MNKYLSQSAIPLYQQLAQILEEDINSGLYPQGSKLPTEHALGQEYHVSRVTVRKALAILADRDEIERKTGNGTYVKERKLRRNLSGNVTSFTQMCLQMGTTPGARTLGTVLEPATEEIAGLMQVPPGINLLVVERVRYSDLHPVLLERDYFTEDFDFLFEEDLNHNSLYQLIRQHKGIHFTHASRTIDIVFASQQEARYLELKPGYPLLRIASITQNQEGNVTTYSQQLCIGDRFRLQV